MSTLRLSSIAAVSLLMLAPAGAQDTERFQLERTGDGYVRLDTATGRMALCTEQGGQLVCRMAAEDRMAYEDQIENLQRRVDELDGRVAALEAGDADRLPPGEELERTLDHMERFFRRFMGIVRELDGGDPAAPDRT